MCNLTRLVILDLKLFQANSSKTIVRTPSTMEPPHHLPAAWIYIICTPYYPEILQLNISFPNMHVIVI